MNSGRALCGDSGERVSLRLLVALLAGEILDGTLLAAAGTDKTS